MRYDIIGSNMQHLDSLNEGERVFADQARW